MCFKLRVSASNELKLVSNAAISHASALLDFGCRRQLDIRDRRFLRNGRDGHT